MYLDYLFPNDHGSKKNITQFAQFIFEKVLGGNCNFDLKIPENPKNITAEGLVYNLVKPIGFDDQGEMTSLMGDLLEHPSLFSPKELGDVDIQRLLSAFNAFLVLLKEESFTKKLRETKSIDVDFFESTLNTFSLERIIHKIRFDLNNLGDDLPQTLFFMPITYALKDIFSQIGSPQEA